MDASEEALQEIHTHARECDLRYQQINYQLERGSKRFDRLEAMIWGVYVTVIIAVALPQFL